MGFKAKAHEFTPVSYPQIESLPGSMNPTETQYLQM
jgi:hypothetical protein